MSIEGQSETPLKRRRRDRCQAMSYRRLSSSAMVASAVFHGVLLGLLSLIILTSTAAPETLITAAFVGPDDTGDRLELTPVVELPTVDVPRQSPVALPPEIPIPIPQIALPMAVAASRTAATDPQSDAPATGTDNEVIRAATAIQGRVEQAGGKKGEVQFALAWKDHNDVDLHVIAPSGEHIAWSHRRSQCHGALDVDMNVRGESDDAVENIRWLPRNTPAGRYTVLVHLYRFHQQGTRRGGPGSDYQLLARTGGDPQLLSGRLELSRRLEVHRFQYVPSTWSFQRRNTALQQLAELQESEEERAAPLLQQARALSPGPSRERALSEFITRFPHTDAAIAAMQLLDAESSK